MIRTALPIALLAASAAAQVPYDYLLVAEQVSSSTAPTLNMVQPSTGVVTPLTIGSVGLWRFLSAVELDPSDPTAVYWSKNPPAQTAASIIHGTLMGADLTSAVQTGIKTNSHTEHMLVYGNNLYYIEQLSASPGLLMAPLAGGVPQLVVTQGDLSDVVLLGGKMYLITYRSGQPSTLIEYDPTNGTQRTLGTSYAAGRAIGHFGPMLLVGDDTGSFYTVDPASGSSTGLIATPHGAIVAIASREGSLLFTFATATGVYEFSNFATPLYTTTGPITDLTLSNHDVASFLTFGQGCGGNPTPVVSANGVPGIANSSFSLQVAQAGANNSVALAVGTSRQTWQSNTLPLSLNSIGMNGCTLYTDIFLTLGMTTNGSGVATLSLPIPAFQWKGGHFTGQYFVVAPSANPLGVVTSNGFEGIVR